MKKKEFVTQDLLSKIYQAEKVGPRKLPTERKLAEEYGVSRQTVREALQKLVSIGIVRIIQGSGAWINESALSNPLIYNSITEKRFDQFRYRMISLHKKRPDRAMQQIFGIDENSFIWNFCRIRYVDDVPVQLQVSSMPVEFFSTLNQQIIEDSIQQYVLSCGLHISHMLTTYRAVNVSREQALILGCKKGSPAMSINNRGILNGGRVFEVSDTLDINYTCTYVIPYNHENLTWRLTQGV